MKEKAVIIVSGGMDSTTLLYDSVDKYDLVALSFDYGQKHSKEVLFASLNCTGLKVPHKIISLPIKDIVDTSALVGDTDVPEGHYEDEVMKKTVVPNRNMIMLSIATAYAINIGATRVLYGAHAGDHAIYPDCRPDFVFRMKQVMEVCDYSKITLDSPYLHMSKGDIASIGKELRVPYKLTWTCYKGQDNPCGVCGACVERAEAFADAGMVDPLCE